jgi:hypothetical protein
LVHASREVRDTVNRSKVVAVDVSKALSDVDRLVALQATGLLDSEPEPLFDQVTRIVADLLNVTSAHVTLVDDHRQFLKSTWNRDSGAATETVEHPLTSSYCKFPVAMREPLLVEDARVHPLVKGNDAIGRGVIAYAGVPLITGDGHAIGVLCAINDKPRPWKSEDVESLEALARSTMALIEPRIRDGNRAARAASDWGVFDVWLGQLLELVEKHLEASDGYERLMALIGSLKPDEEARARENVRRGLEALRQHYRQRGMAELAGPQEQFARTVGDYLDADAARREAVAGFTLSKVTTGEVEVASARVREAEDALRLSVRRLGVSPRM